MTSSRFPLYLAALAALVVALAQARASPLDADSCAKLQLEQTALEQAGVEADMAKGPDWASANLPPRRIDQILRFIEVQELLLFRCKGKSLVDLNDPDDDDKDDDKAAAAPKPAVPPPSAAKKAKAPAAATKAPAAAPKKKSDPGKKAAVQPPVKPAGPQPKQAPGAAKKAPAKAAAPTEAVAKQPPARKEKPPAPADE